MSCIISVSTFIRYVVFSITTYSIQVTEYSVNNKLIEEPAFHWWVRHILRNRDGITSKMKSSYLRKTHKYEIAIPKDIDNAIKLDISNGIPIGWML